MTIVINRTYKLFLERQVNKNAPAIIIHIFHYAVTYTDKVSK